MILKKKIVEIKLVNLFLRYFKKFIFYLGLLFFGIILLAFIYYYSSGLQKRFSATQLIFQINDKILKKYVGFDLRQSGDYINILSHIIFKNFGTNSLENVFIEIDQESIFALELQRKIRSKNGGELLNEYKVYHPAKLKLNNNNYNIKIRTKGVRNIHWKDKDTTSYKIDIIGDNRLWGMEEFSFQKPITRNYTYEYLFHNLLGYVDLIRIKYFFVNLYFNDQNLGVYAVEESFSKELIERQKKRNGPIFSIRDELGEYFPNIAFELYSENFWINEHPELIENAFSTLNNLKKENFNINQGFDIDKWAKYFAIMDITGAYHGSLIKSVKLYYNPTTALFEPIGYDLHKGAGIFDNFIISDFLQEDDITTSLNCSYICNHKEWYLKFLKLDDGTLNYQFVKKYTDYLKKYSNKEFIDSFVETYSKELNRYNKSIYKDNSKTDKIFWSGLGYFVYDDEYLYKRASLINSRINSINLKEVDVSLKNNQFIYEDYSINNFPILAKTSNCKLAEDNKNLFFAGKMSFEFVTSCKEIELLTNLNEVKSFYLEENIKLSSNDIINIKNDFRNLSMHKNVLKISQNKFKFLEPIQIDENTLINKNDIFIFDEKSKIDIINGSTLFVDGSINFINKKDQLTEIFSSDKTGSIIFNNNFFNFKNLSFKNLSKPNLKNYILYGGVNFINSEVNLENIYINDSNNEDALNLVNSKSQISNLYFKNIKADALDVDFGKLNFINIKCENVTNDCLDLSGVNVNGKGFYSENTNDKGISIGEETYATITDLKIIKNNIGLAVKDGSFANVENINFEANKYDIAIFNKKSEFLKPSLTINKSNSIDSKKILQSIGTKLSINQIDYNGKLNDKYINSKIY